MKVSIASKAQKSANSVRCGMFSGVLAAVPFFYDNFESSFDVSNAELMSSVTIIEHETCES